MMKRRKTDFHIHTCYSDGAHTPSDIVMRYKKKDYDIIAITDHDTTWGIPEALEAGERFGIKVVPGIEFSTRNEAGIEIHMLGYNIDINNEELICELQKIREARRMRNEKLIAYFAEEGYELSYEELLEGKKGDYLGKPDFGRAMARKGYISEPREIFAPGKFLESPKALAIKKEMIDTDASIKLIEKAGGVSVLAHPMKIKGIGEKGSEEFYSRLRVIIEGLVEAGLSGLECYHSDHTMEQAERLVQLAEEMGLLVTNGSDFHGEEFKKRAGFDAELENVRIKDIYIDKIIEQM